MNKRDLSSLISENKTLLTLLMVGLFLMELQIFAVAAGKSGKESWVKILDANGHVVHQIRGGRLGDADREYVEKTFGPLKQLEVRLVATDEPFPFRAWFVAAVGLPVAVVLLFSFIVKAYAALFYGDAGSWESDKGKREFDAPDTRLDKVLTRISRYNVYTIGFLIFMAVFAYWVVPNFISFIGRLGLESLIRFKWFFIAAAVLFVGFAAWIVYLRYLLAKRAMDTQMETEKYRLELEYGQRATPPAQIGYGVGNGRPRKVLPEDAGQSQH
jgi:hypothetical protein